MIPVQHSVLKYYNIELGWYLQLMLKHPLGEGSSCCSDWLVIESEARGWSSSSSSWRGVQWDEQGVAAAAAGGVDSARCNSA